MHSEMDRPLSSLEPRGSASGSTSAMPEEILGIALVVGGHSRGSQLVFRYPSMHTSNAAADGRQSESQPGAKEVNSVCGIKAESFAHMMCPKPALCGQLLNLAIDDYRFLGFPTLLEEHSWTPAILTMNVVLILRASPVPRDRLQQHYSTALGTLATAFKHEQQRCGYLSEQTQLIQKIEARLAFPLCTMAELQEAVMAGSGLARGLKGILFALQRDGVVHTKVNEWVAVSINLHHSIEDQKKIVDSIRPFHTLLLLPESQQSEWWKAGDASPWIARLVARADPKKSLHELHLEMGIPMGQLTMLAAHLVYWKRARIIHTLTQHSMYVVSPRCDLAPHSRMMKAFEQFQKEARQGQSKRSNSKVRRLAEVLAHFSVPMHLGEKLSHLNNKDDQKDLVQLVVWLLKWGALIHLHHYVVMIPTDPVDPSLEAPTEARIEGAGPEESLESLAASGEDPGANDDKFSASADSSWLMEARAAYVKQHSEGGSRAYQLLAKLYGYFDGRHVLEEIMWKENVSREDISQVLNTYKEVLFVCIHEST